PPIPKPTETNKLPDPGLPPPPPPIAKDADKKSPADSTPPPSVPPVIEVKKDPAPEVKNPPTTKEPPIGVIPPLPDPKEPSPPPVPPISPESKNLENKAPEKAAEKKDTPPAVDVPPPPPAEGATKFPIDGRIDPHAAINFDPKTAEKLPPVENCPWTLRLEIVKGKTKLTASIGKKVQFRVLCDKLNLQAPRGSIEALGAVKITSSGLEGTCDRLAIAWQEDRVVLDGKAQLKCQREGNDLELKADQLSLRLTPGEGVVTKNSPAVLEKGKDFEFID